MKIVTERLELILLTPEQLDMWCKNISNLENSLGCTYQGEPIVGTFLNIVKNQISVCENDIEHIWCRSFWLIVRRTDKVIVGSCCFKAPPNEAGEIEIGYGLGNTHEHNGYMTECVKSISLWALKFNEVHFVIAETEPNNKPSENVLIRCGFKNDTTIHGNKWWKL